MATQMPRTQEPRHRQYPPRDACSREQMRELAGPADPRLQLVNWEQLAARLQQVPCPSSGKGDFVDFSSLLSLLEDAIELGQWKKALRLELVPKELQLSDKETQVLLAHLDRYHPTKK
jgi:hypothetical protein